MKSTSAARWLVVKRIRGSEVAGQAPLVRQPADTVSPNCSQLAAVDESSEREVSKRRHLRGLRRLVTI